MFSVGNRFCLELELTRSHVLNSEHISSDKAFLFSLRNRNGTAFKMAVKQGEEWRATISWKNNGPTFGGGWDLYIANTCHTNANSYSKPGWTYQLPAGYTWDTPQSRSLLAGSHNFKCDDYEVFIQQ